MNTETIKERIERYKIKAEVFLENNIKAFIVDVEDTYYFCNIIFVGDKKIYIQHFKGKKKDEKERLFYVDIVKLVEYKDKEEVRNNGTIKRSD